MAFVEPLNKILAEQLFKVQEAQKLNGPERELSTLVKHLHGLVDHLNDTKTQMTGMSKDAIKLKKVSLVESYPLEDTLPEDGLFRYLLQLREEHDDQHKRATNRVWSWATYRLREVVEDSGNRVIYYLSDAPLHQKS